MRVGEFCRDGLAEAHAARRAEHRDTGSVAARAVPGPDRRSLLVGRSAVSSTSFTAKGTLCNGPSAGAASRTDASAQVAAAPRLANARTDCARSATGRDKRRRGWRR
jgi:hypothetical protein